MAKANRWKNYFEQLLNHTPVPCSHFPRNAQEDHPGCLVPSESEVHSAVRKLKNGKAPGLCGITAEMLKASGNPGIQWLTGVIKLVWQSGLREIGMVVVPLRWLRQQLGTHCRMNCETLISTVPPSDAT